jgi:hypothetical protein
MRADVLVFAVVSLSFTSGCSTMSNTEAGAGAGGLIGAGAGAIIGHAAGHTGAGALIGAGVGAVTGGLVGHAEDEAEKRAAEARAARILGMNDIVQMAHSGVSDRVIISQIYATGSVYRLSPSDTIWLREQGVSDTVVRAMVDTAYYYPRRTRWVAPAYVEPVYAAPQPPVEVIQSPIASSPGPDLPTQPIPVR